MYASFDAAVVAILRQSRKKCQRTPAHAQPLENLLRPAFRAHGGLIIAGDRCPMRLASRTDQFVDKDQPWMTLSVLCLTHFPAAQVTALLRQLRPVADEIVLGVDSRLGEAEAAKYWAAADRLMRYEFVDNAQRAMAWAHSQCRGEWVLRLDGDEVVRPALLSALPRLVARRDVLQYYVLRRWLFPDANGWLNELPWFPDYQNWLVRNDATLWFDGRAHTSAYETLPARYLEEPIYHLNLLLMTGAERIAKMEIYEGRRAGLLAPGGGSVNRFYLPVALRPDGSERRAGGRSCRNSCRARRSPGAATRIDDRTTACPPRRDRPLVELAPASARGLSSPVGAD
jgi:hypothetical protein